MNAHNGGWLARAWLPYLAIGPVWMIAGAVLLGYPRGLGLTFTGLACLGLGGYGVILRRRSGLPLLGR